MQSHISTQQNSSTHPVIHRLFEQRNSSKNKIEDFLSWDLKALPLLTELKDLEKSSIRIIEAINKNEKIFF